MHRINQFLMVLTLSAGVVAYSVQAQEQHFHPKGKPPSKFTIELQQGLRATLPFEDQRDFEEAKKGFIAAPPYKQIKAEAGHVAWDMASYEFLLKGKDFASIHPSLQRQAVLNMAYGLYEVVPGKIYQVRGFDLANVTLIKGDTGWIVYRSPNGQGDGEGSARFRQREARAAPGSCGHLHALTWRSLRRRARRGRGGRREERQGQGHRARRLHASRGGRERHGRHGDDPANVLPIRRAAFAQPVRPRRPGNRQEHRGRQHRADRAESSSSRSRSRN